MSTGTINTEKLQIIVNALNTLNQFVASKENVFSNMNAYRHRNAIRDLMAILNDCGYTINRDGQLTKFNFDSDDKQGKNN